ncbi:hypothetical protein Pla163_10920 [Planctomycetes bacterium Pla163]|uniref:Uncharacterized protein n=2 Tax=Rohdeia mirabilis TaxID=2528008 RepID=A0A518CXN9_9BACT|nr:hypothetical protein Pla163_10920 [Planctomycetes bacterium Pla163]
MKFTSGVGFNEGGNEFQVGDIDGASPDTSRVVLARQACSAVDQADRTSVFGLKITTPVNGSNWENGAPTVRVVFDCTDCNPAQGGGN